MGKVTWQECLPSSKDLGIEENSNVLWNEESSGFRVNQAKVEDLDKWQRAVKQHQAREGGTLWTVELKQEAENGGSFGSGSKNWAFSDFIAEDQRCTYSYGYPSSICGQVKSSTWSIFPMEDPGLEDYEELAGRSCVFRNNRRPYAFAFSPQLSLRNAARSSA